MKDREINKTASVAGRVSEFPVSSMTYEDMVLGSVRLDGMKLCAGCEEVFVLCGFCGNCKRINADLEARCRARMQAVDRVDNGTVEFEELETECPASPVAIGVICFGALCSAMLLMTVLWFVGRGLVGICLEHSR